MEAECYDVVPYLRDHNMENALQAQRLYDRHLGMEADARLFLPLLPSRVRSLVKQWKDNIYADAFYRNTSDPPEQPEAQVYYAEFLELYQACRRPSRQSLIDGFLARTWSALKFFQMALRVDDDDYLYRILP